MATIVQLGVGVAKCVCMPVAKFVCMPVPGMVKDWWELQANMVVLVRKNKELIAQETDIRRKVQRGGDRGMMPTDTTNQLLETVEEVKRQVSVIPESLEESKKHFFGVFSRLKIAKHVLDLITVMDSLLEDTGKFTNNVVVEESKPRALALAADPLVGESTVEKNLEAILGSLRNPVIRKIGIYAMGGSGKTTTMKTINNQLATTNDFNLIIWVTVSKDFILDKVQTNIAQQLDLDLSRFGDQEQRAAELYCRLNQVNKFLIILDDIWDLIPLNQVGIPEPHKKNECKIVLTTRSLAVCRKMETDKNIKLELLSEDEAWKLFVSKAGNQILTPKVKPLAEEVVRECDGLPLGIITVGRAMREEAEEGVWRNTLKSLRRSPSEFRDMKDKVFELLLFSYSRLKNDVARKCFLYLALFPEDHEIETDELIRYWMAESLISEEGNLESERDEGQVVFKELVDSCMFEDIIEVNDYTRTSFHCIRMHDSLRDLAIDIMGKEGGLLIKPGLSLVESPKPEEWEQARIISLIGNEIDVLPIHPNCPHLSTLLLQYNSLLEIIPASFFYQMPSLQVLDLSFTGVQELPSSLSNLVNLCALFLRRCENLRKIPSLAKLEKLKTLNISSTSIEKLPEGMERLRSLRSLNISFTSNLEICTIPKLPLLEELRMEASLFLEMDSSTIGKCMSEIGSLNRLAILTVNFTRMDDYLNAISCVCVQLTKLKIFNIILSDSTRWISRGITWINEGIRASQGRVFVENQEMDNHEAGPLFPPNTQDLDIKNSDIPRLSVLLRNLRFLNKCCIRGCSLTSGDALVLGDELKEFAFISLECLEIRVVDKFAVLCKGMVPHAFLSNLRVLKILYCIGLKNLIFINSLNVLINIESIEVGFCESMEQIIVDSDEGTSMEDSVESSTTRILLPKLHTLIFNELSALQTISSMIWVSPSLRFLTISYCSNLKKLPFSFDTLADLKELEISDSDWWEALEWDDPNIKSLLKSRFGGDEEDE